MNLNDFFSMADTIFSLTVSNFLLYGSRLRNRCCWFVICLKASESMYQLYKLLLALTIMLSWPLPDVNGSASLSSLLYFFIL